MSHRPHHPHRSQVYKHHSVMPGPSAFYWQPWSTPEFWTAENHILCSSLSVSKFCANMLCGLAIIEENAMRDLIQSNYEERLNCYAGLIHGNAPPGLVAKLAMYSAFIKEFSKRSDELWEIEPLLDPLIRSVEVDLHLATAKLLEDPRRSERSIFAFLDFCTKNRSHITWKSGSPPESLLLQQLNDLEAHSGTIATIMARRDKFFAHLDKKYFANPREIYTDYPLDQSAVIKLVNCIINIISEHQRSLSGTVNFHLGEFFEIGVENMIRNLEAGRRVNFSTHLDNS